MSDSRSSRWPNEPALVLSHSVATDQIGRSLKGLAGAAPVFRFCPSTEEANWEIGETLTSLLDIRNAYEAGDAVHPIQHHAADSDNIESAHTNISVPGPEARVSHGSPSDSRASSRTAANAVS